MRKSILFVMLILFAFTSCKEKDGTVFNKKVAVVDTGSVTFNGVSAMQTVKDMKTGWNLGNTMDAIGASGMGSETSWGMPRTTKAMIDTLAASGIKTIRIPTSWSLHLIDQNYTIDPTWMARVKDIVDWAIENDMYVILNSHHDCWEKPSAIPYGKGYYPNPENLEESLRFLTNVWAQICLAFNNGYDEHLIFETMNEPRLRGTDTEWWNDRNSKEYEDAADCLNKENQAVVDIIRKSGGNNQKRYIMVPGLRAAIDSALAQEFKLPVDDEPGKLILSVHMYDPFDFAMNAKGPVKFEDRFKKTLVMSFKSLNTFYVSKDIPVVIGEYGATNKNNLEDRVEWFKFFIKNSRKYGMTACLWDNGVFDGSNKDGEKFGFFNRRTLKWQFPEILEAINTTVEEVDN